MTTLIKADFNGTSVLFKNDAYLNATSIAKRFNKQPRDYLKSSRTKEYINALINLQKTIKTKILIEENQLVIVKGGSTKNGGGTWLHPKLAIDFARWLSAEFAVWCDEQIENILYAKSDKPKLEDLSTVASRTPLKDAVAMLVARKQISYSDGYKMLHQRFAVESVGELTNEQIPQAVEYVHTLLCGEYIPYEVREQISDLSRRDQYAAATYCHVAYLRLNDLMSISNEIEDLQSKLKKTIKYMHDPITHASAHISSGTDRKAVHEKVCEFIKDQGPLITIL